MQEFEMEDRIEERILAHEKKTKRSGMLHDDYETDCIEIWNAIEALQEEVKRLKAVNRVLMLKNGIITKKEA